MTANSNISVPPYGLFYFKFARGAQLGARGRNPLDPWGGLPDPVNSIERMNESQKGNFTTRSRLFLCLFGCLYGIFISVCAILRTFCTDMRYLSAPCIQSSPKNHQLAADPAHPVLFLPVCAPRSAPVSAPAHLRPAYCFPAYSSCAAC